MDDQDFYMVVKECLNYTTQKVLLKHIQHGVGRVVKLYDNLVTIYFDEISSYKDFMFPDAIGEYLFPVKNIATTNKGDQNIDEHYAHVEKLSQEIQVKRTEILKKRKLRMERIYTKIACKAEIERKERERIIEAKKRIYNQFLEKTEVQQSDLKDEISKKKAYKICPKCELNLIPIDKELCFVCQRSKQIVGNYTHNNKLIYKKALTNLSNIQQKYSDKFEDEYLEYLDYLSKQSDEIVEDKIEYVDRMYRSDNDGWYYEDYDKSEDMGWHMADIEDDYLDNDEGDCLNNVEDDCSDDFDDNYSDDFEQNCSDKFEDKYLEYLDYLSKQSDEIVEDKIEYVDRMYCSDNDGWYYEDYYKNKT